MMPEVSLFLAFGVGVVSFFSPCILPLLPAYLSFITGATVEEVLADQPRRRSVLPKVILFCLGFSVVFVLMGATASALGQAVFRYQRVIQWVGGGLVILFGLHLLGILNVRILQMEKRIHIDNRPAHGLAAFVIGITFAAGWTPCIGPALAAILTMAGTRETLGQGVMLLAIFSLGLSVPFLALGFAMDYFLPWFNRVKRIMRWVSVVSGVLLIVIGILIITENMNRIYSWIL
jgi:cytochrome c-type biogenesis protein